MPAESPPFSVVLPLLLFAPAGLIAAGLLLLAADSDTLVAINAPHTIAVVHAVAIGWASTTIMGASYQLLQAVFGGRLFSYSLARIQIVIHLLAAPAFVWSAFEWNTMWMAVAGTALSVSFLLYAVLSGVALARATRRGVVHFGMALGLVGLVVTFGFGLTWVGALYHLWFPITLGLLSAHAHVGLAGWLGITILSVSEQLVPMFSLTTQQRPSRLPWVAIALTAAAVALFASVLPFEPEAPVRVLLGAFLAAGPAVWAFGIVSGFRARSRRKLDIHGRATMLALPCLGVAALVGFGAAAGTPFTTDEEPARWLLAYGALFLGGFVGATLVGNSLKIVPFLVWIHRYQKLAGKAPVPVIADLVNVRLQHMALGLVVTGSNIIAAGALAGSLLFIRIGGGILSAGGLSLAGALWWSLLPAQSSRQPIVARKVVT
ncbi:MAG: hypothetical protein AB7T37_18535 [Dehalococcoidia bacterium]